ncbi:unnamed protein product, partial [Amoebophrya sp. A25]
MKPLLPKEFLEALDVTALVSSSDEDELNMAGEEVGGSGQQLQEQSASSTFVSGNKKSLEVQTVDSATSSSKRKPLLNPTKLINKDVFPYSLLFETVPAVYHFREKPSDTLYALEALAFYFALRAVALKVKPCWAALKKNLFRQEGKLRWSDFRRVLDMTLAEAGEKPLPECYWSLLRVHPTWWSIPGQYPMPPNAPEPIFEVVAFVSDMQTFPEIMATVLMNNTSVAAAVDENAVEQEKGGKQQHVTFSSSADNDTSRRGTGVVLQDFST